MVYSETQAYKKNNIFPYYNHDKNYIALVAKTEEFYFEVSTECY